jgi:branched-subunit amino acid aminotransferase/4-amino-4-deoxychorismate lyase
MGVRAVGRMVSPTLAVSLPCESYSHQSCATSRDRATFEKKKANDTDEVVLFDDEGRVYEGLSSNFFVVMDGKRTYRQLGKKIPSQVHTSSVVVVVVLNE